MLKFVSVPIVALTALVMFVSCSSKNDGSTPTTTPQTNYTVSGSVASLSVMSVLNSSDARTLAKTITHVMAVSAVGDRFVGGVDASGAFSLGINAGQPYTFVFIDDSQVGENMVVGILKPDAGSTDLDTLIPATAGSTSLGAVNVNGTAQTASMSTNLNDFLSAMGVDSAAATTIGSVDDLALRLANPDVDSNGKIDALESTGVSNARVDIHVRSTIGCTSGCANSMPIDNFTGTFITDVPGYVISPGMTSVYAVYPSSFDANPVSQWISNSGVSTTLDNGATFAVTAMPNHPGPDIDALDSYSGGSFSDNFQWGPDYHLNTGGKELPGYDKFVKLNFGFNSKSLSFPFFRTRAKANLFHLIPDFKLNVSGGVIVSLEYRWLKWTGSAWAAATTTEVKMLVSDDSARFGFYTAKSAGVEESVGVSIPTASASGTIAWTAANVEKSSGVAQDVTAMAITDFCSGVSSYDDKLGLRIFAHTFAPSTSGGPSPCF